jgi:hypothetical protein
MKHAVTIAAIALAWSASSSRAQSAPAYQSVEGIMTELYASVSRLPGQPFAWDRLRAILLPGAIMLPQPRQTQSTSRIMNGDEFIEWIDSGWKPIIGTASDHGFFERQTNLVVDQYGDIAQAFSTYEKGPHEPRQIQGRGINTVQLVRRDGRWWILSIAWDEENSAGPLPEKYRGR